MERTHLFEWDLIDDTIRKRNRKRSDEGEPELTVEEFLEQEEKILDLVWEASSRSVTIADMKEIFTVDDEGNWKLPGDYISELVRNSVNGVIHDSRKLFSNAGDIEWWFGEGEEAEFFHSGGLEFAAFQNEEGLTSLYHLTEAALPNLLLHIDGMDIERISNAVQCYSQFYSVLENIIPHREERKESVRLQEWDAYMAGEAARLDVAGRTDSTVGQAPSWLAAAMEDTESFPRYHSVYDREKELAESANHNENMVAVLQKVRDSHEIVYTSIVREPGEDPGNQWPEKQFQELKDREDRGEIQISCLHKKLGPGDILVFQEKYSFPVSYQITEDGSLEKLKVENSHATFRMYNRIRNRMDLNREHACYCSLYSYAGAYGLENLKNTLSGSMRFRQLEEYSRLYDFYLAGDYRMPEHPVLDLAGNIQNLYRQMGIHDTLSMPGEADESMVRDIARDIWGGNVRVHADILQRELGKGNMPEDLAGEMEKTLLTLEACQTFYQKEKLVAIKDIDEYWFDTIYPMGDKKIYRIMGLDEKGNLGPVNDIIFQEKKKALDYCFSNCLRPVHYNRLIIQAAINIGKKQEAETADRSVKTTLVINLYGMAGTDAAESLKRDLEKQGYTVPVPLKPEAGCINNPDKILEFIESITGMYGTVDFLIVEMPPITPEEDSLMVELTKDFDHVNVVSGSDQTGRMQPGENTGITGLLDQYGLNYLKADQYSRDALLKKIMGTRSLYQNISYALVKMLERKPVEEMEESPHGEENEGKENSSNMDQKEQLMQKLKDGIKGTLDSQKFADWCRKQSRLYYNHYSFRNAILTYLQKPDASYTCGYETWKKYGRQVKQGAEAIKIFCPVFAREYGGKGSLLSAIRKSCRAQMDKDPSLEYGTFRLGQSSLTLNMYKNGLYDVKFGEQCIMAHSTAEVVRKFLDTQIIGRLPVGYNVVSVFDISDTTDEAEYLWVNETSCRPDEMVLDDKGSPIRDRRGNVKIRNSDERRMQFNNPLDHSVKEQDAEKMELLYSALKTVCTNKGIPVSEVPEKEDQKLAGAKGYWHRPDEEYERGYIVIKDELTPTEKVKVLLHEAAHADLHRDLGKLAEEMGKEKLENPRSLKEVQAEAVAYMAASTFGLETDHSSFTYISRWSDGRELKALEESMEIIYRESQKLVREIEKSLDEMGLDLELEPNGRQALTGEEKEKAVAGYMEFFLTFMDENECIQNMALEELNSLQDEEHRTIVKEQIAAACDIDDKLASLHKKIEQFQTADTLEQQVILQRRIRAGMERIKTAWKKIQDLDGERGRISLEADKKTPDAVARIFADRPMEVLDRLQKDRGLLTDIHDNGLKYIASSHYVREHYAKVLGTDPEEFDALCRKRLADLQKVLSRNGVAIEISFCESGSRIIPVGGTLLNPRAANRIMAEAEEEIRKTEQAYLKCYLSIYTVNGKNEMSVLDIRVDVGDGSQKDLKDFLVQVCTSSEEKNILDKFEKSLRERSGEKILIPPVGTTGRESAGEASRPADVWKGMMASFQKNTDQEEKGETSRKMECDVKEKS